MTGLISYKGFSLDDTPPLEGRVCVITGGQAGIGKEITAQLLIHGISRVYVLARSSPKFELAKKFWSESHKLTAEDIAERVEFVPCDLSDITVVKKVGDTLMGKLDRLDMLIENAGQQPFMEILRQTITIRRSSNCCPLHTFPPRYRDNLGN
jgi:NAD(P)-dependent dehydrogenase (short-subunit alcohol dehydrogenase family)